MRHIVDPLTHEDSPLRATKKSKTLCGEPILDSNGHSLNPAWFYETDNERKSQLILHRGHDTCEKCIIILLEDGEYCRLSSMAEQ